MTNTKAGFIAIIGKPNAGKSTLMNSILGTKLSIVTHKPQTTRKRVLGICTNGNAQMVFFDTPGMLAPKYEMQRQMMQFVQNSIEEADILAMLVDLTKYSSDEEFLTPQFVEALKSSKKPIIAILNKIDLLKDVKEVLPVIADLNKLGVFKELVPICALKPTNAKDILAVFEKYLPESEFFYDEELLSTQNERFFVSELIREVVFNEFKDEIPYSTEVNITEFKEREFGKWYISAEIIVEKNSQKPIIIGAEGKKIRIIGELARKAIEQHLEMAVYLDLFVKVRDNWRNNKNLLKSYGY